MAATSIEDWTQVPWRKLEASVYRLQKRIYRAAQRGNTAAVHSLQRLLMKSKAARYLAVRRVTQENQGKNTAGIDGVKAIGPTHRPLVAELLREARTIKPKPTRRVWIPKPGKQEKRPLSIPTLLDRAHQALAKLALEPEWEAHFEPNSYGFRPGRSAHDAIQAVFLQVYLKPKYVLDADIQGCFDNIAHEPLLKKLNTYPAMRQAIKAWLKAGVLDGGVFVPTPKGSPQGGIISPLLANVALHGLEYAVRTCHGTREEDKPKLLRYADDLVILHPDRAVIDTAKAVLEQQLADMGLALKPSKTRIVHTLEPLEDQAPGFDFLGFTVRQYPVGKYRSGVARSGMPLGFTALITPSKDAIQRHYADLRAIVVTGKTLAQEVLIAKLNPVIRGWSQYYRTVVAKTTFSDLDNRLFPLLLHWAKRRHRDKNGHWVYARYWRTEGRDHWCFAPPAGVRLIRHTSTRIQRHVKVRGTASPYDGNLLYWARRLQHSPLLLGRTAKLLKQQDGACARCGLLFTDQSQCEIDHIDPTGSDAFANLQLLHRHCHDQKTAADYAAGQYASQAPRGRGAG
jgi:RNA-directed DNA polymerase